ncbi:hypothetical protein [Streptomyces sp. NPDC102282]|uniref:hypothetical protein n=1 Tax=Streptomyces sp. NPDC102282 TaxID=3366154 RepID=UPI0038233156
MISEPEMVGGAGGGELRDVVDDGARVPGERRPRSPWWWALGGMAAASVLWVTAGVLHGVGDGGGRPAPMATGWTPVIEYAVMVQVELHKETDPRAEFEARQQFTGRGFEPGAEVESVPDLGDELSPHAGGRWARPVARGRFFRLGCR